MSSARRHESRPVVVEVRPDHAADISPRSRSPKVVHFAPTSAGMVTGISRELTATEAWSLYHFEHHAKYCTACHDPYKSFKRTKTGSLCATGLALAQDVVYHVRYIDGEVYSTATDAGQLVRVEVPPKYDNLRGLVKAVARGMRVHRAAPVVHHAYAHPLTPPLTPDPEEAEHHHDLFSSSPRRRHATVIIEPASSDASRRATSHRHSYHHEPRYPRVVVTEPSTLEEEEVAAAPHRRGTLYEKDLQRSQERYRTEIREPSPSARLTLAHQQQQQQHHSHHRRHREEQRQTVYFA